jgi:hypothetical protein
MNVSYKFPVFSFLSHERPDTGTDDSRKAGRISSEVCSQLMPTSPQIKRRETQVYLTTRTEIGRGSFSYGSPGSCLTLRTVFSAIQQATGKVVAAKQINLYNHDDVYRKEVRILSSLDHPNLVRFYASEVHSFSNTGNIKLEFQ